MYINTQTHTCKRVCWEFCYVANATKMFAGFLPFYGSSGRQNSPTPLPPSLRGMLPTAQTPTHSPATGSCMQHFVFSWIAVWQKFCHLIAAFLCRVCCNLPLQLQLGVAHTHASHTHRVWAEKRICSCILRTLAQQERHTHAHRERRTHAHTHTDRQSGLDLRVLYIEYRNIFYILH